MSAQSILLALLTLFAIAFIAMWWGARRGAGARALPAPRHVIIGAIANFFDTLGVGSFATTTSLFKLGHVIDDRDIPGTLNVGHALPIVTQALIYIAVIEVDGATLATFLGAAALGAYFGAGVVSRWPRRRIQIGMGLLLLVAAGIITFRQVTSVPNGDALGLSDARLVIGAAGNFVLGALMTLGIGLYAPCMILVGLLGMNARAAFPIMMGSCAFLMPVASLRFLKAERYDPGAALGLTLGGVPAVLVAAFFVRSLPLAAVQWLVVVVVVYTAGQMLRAATTRRNSL